MKDIHRAAEARNPLRIILTLMLLAGALAVPSLARGQDKPPLPSVVASIGPVQSLAAGVMAGLGVPRVLLPAGASPHDYSMKPSDARALADADLVLWIGPGMEQFLVRPLETLAERAEKLSLIRASGVRVYTARSGGAWEENGHGEAHEHEQHEAHKDAHDHDGDDTHIWLDPRNAIAMTRAIAGALARLDPARAPAYRANAEAYAGRLRALDSRLAERMAPVSKVPYVLFHDAYRYFEERYGLNAVGAVTVSPGRGTGAKRIMELREKIVSLKAACVFAEPQFEPRLLSVLAEGTGARVGTLDPLGAKLPLGPDMYPTLMERLAADLISCLKA